jgi:hypothetical protein
VADACDIPSLNTTHRALRDARRLGLVAFEDHRAGTLRVTAEVVALNPDTPDP